MKKAKIEFHSVGHSGNIYSILTELRKELRKQNRITDYNNARERIMGSASYIEAIAIVREFVDLIDLDGNY